MVDYKDGQRKEVRHVVSHEDQLPLKDGPSPGLKMHPSITSKRKSMGVDETAPLRMPTVQQKGMDRSLMS